jgi:hypothetical protein
VSAGLEGFVGPPPRKVRGLSWGALLFTPLWLIRHGFWITAILHAVCARFVWPLALIISFLFFFLGAQWSWSKGERWRSYEEYCTSRFNWDFLSLAAMTFAVLAIAIEACL